MYADIAMDEYIGIHGLKEFTQGRPRQVAIRRLFSVFNLLRCTNALQAKRDYKQRKLPILHQHV